jgi:hypothetical protein
MKKIFWDSQWWEVRPGCLVSTIEYDEGDIDRSPRLCYQENLQTTIWLAMRITGEVAATLEWLDQCEFREVACV